MPPTQRVVQASSVIVDDSTLPAQFFLAMINMGQYNDSSRELKRRKNMLRSAHTPGGGLAMSLGPAAART